MSYLVDSSYFKARGKISRGGLMHELGLSRNPGCVFPGLLDSNSIMESLLQFVGGKEP